MEDQVTRQLLHLYIRGICSPSEKLQVEEYLRSEKSNLLIDRVLDEYWAELDTAQSATDKTDHYYSKFKTRYQLKSPPVKKLKWHESGLLKYAALLVLGLGAVFYYLGLRSTPDSQTSSITFVKKYNPLGQRSIVTLPDSSVVYLGPESWIKFPREFLGHTREVSFQGEGFFDVKHRASNPFIVQSNGIKTIVLGTSFKIETFRPHTISISVATGKVSVGKVLSNKKYQPLAVLTHGKRAVYNTEKQKIVIDDMPVNDLLVWKEGGMVFRNLTLAEISQRLERWYKVKIIIGKKMEGFRISASFGNVTINEVMEVISRTAGLRYRISNQIIYLTKTSMKKT
ncbi:FecR family protein [Mucilaginibacter sp. UR6-11]|uniref:FecR family protein n=1 Tax=Mucilaginibacter sp. UR6-11 TaxID=1435644 RepID=UPI001E31F318|nr:FecR domain-containing protein [Mucilaginibacter sp. UR6-11]MCC8424585.1 DUF4974 domain-containing protein [Mucilaginibacter sp. UR6-11]